MEPSPVSPYSPVCSHQGEGMWLQGGSWKRRHAGKSLLLGGRPRKKEMWMRLFHRWVISGCCLIGRIIPESLISWVSNGTGSMDHKYLQIISCCRFSNCFQRGGGYYEMTQCEIESLGLISMCKCDVSDASGLPHGWFWNQEMFDNLALSWTENFHLGLFLSQGVHV